jgi:1D-myo-inositol-tetrakisphosphate 5-kinase/inositol-polyphosphate multikinase
MLTPKSYGKGIKAEEMPGGMIRFFPSPYDTIASLVLPQSPPPSTSIPTDTATYQDHAIPAKIMLRVLALVDKQLADLEAVLKSLEMRFVGSSVLIIYEGDLPRLEDALEQWETRIHQEDPLKAELDMEDDQDDMIDSESESDESDDLDGTKEDEKMAKNCPPVVVKMIDFAHTWIAEGQGVDEGVFKGLGTLRSLIEGRKAELEAVV